MTKGKAPRTVIYIDVGRDQIWLNEAQHGVALTGTTPVVPVGWERLEEEFGPAPDFPNPQRFIGEDLAALGIEAELTYTGICG